METRKNTNQDELSFEEKGAIDLVLNGYGINRYRIKSTLEAYYKFAEDIKKIINRDRNNPNLDREISEIAEEYAIKDGLNKDALIKIAMKFKNKH
ncbi:hypothetical protein HS7_20430 [Sulfolobales archaeon HS-7]|nr:hypothetical protein HS7_20430 [Sulfolobales archaeon HS-7]